MSGMAIIPEGSGCTLSELHNNAHPGHFPYLIIFSLSRENKTNKRQLVLDSEGGSPLYSVYHWELKQNLHL